MMLSLCLCANCDIFKSIIFDNDKCTTNYFKKTCDCIFFQYIFLDFIQEDNHSDVSHQILKVLVVHGADGEEPVDASVVLEGKVMLPGCGNAAKPCTLLMGLIYALSLAYPPPPGTG